MDNFFFGIQSLSFELIEFVRQMFAFKFLWGFLVGYFIATLIAAYVSSEENPIQIPKLLFIDKAKNFQKKFQKKNQVYTQSFQQFSKQIDQLKTIFSFFGIFIFIFLTYVFIRS